MSSSLSLSLAGSPSIALTTTVPPPAACATASLMAAGNPAPPRPARPEASSMATKCSRQPRSDGRRERRRAERGDVAGQVGRMTEQPVAAGVGQRPRWPSSSTRSRSRATVECEVLRGHFRRRRACAARLAAWRDTVRSRQASAAATESDADHAEQDHPLLAGVRAHAERVRQRDRPAEVGQPVDGPPCPRAHPAPEQAGDEDGDHQVERHGAHADPEARVAAT